MTDADGADWPPMPRYVDPASLRHVDPDYWGQLKGLEHRMSQEEIDRAVGRVMAQTARSLDERLASGAGTGAAYFTMEVKEMDTPLPTSRRREILAREAARHEERAAKARERLEAIDGIPDRDPFPDTSVLLVTRKGYTYAILRIAGYWYGTGRPSGANLYRAPWLQLVDWLVDGQVEAVTLLKPADTVRLNDLQPPPEPQPLRQIQCNLSFTQGTHTPHAWPQVDPAFWCSGEAVTPEIR